MEWTVTIEGPDEFGEIQRAQVQIEKGFERLASGEIGLSIDDGKRIMSALQEFVVKEELATYALARRVCVFCERLRPVKDYTSRKIRTVFGTVVVKNPRLMVCQRCFPHLSMAFTVLGEICPDRATPQLMELTVRLARRGAACVTPSVIKPVVLLPGLICNERAHACPMIAIPPPDICRSLQIGKR